ncbi:MAG: 1-deoxy-D-xylulose-5-phosphate reductoisomerase, partial [Thermoanaerobaculia bacterium]|nr:1-deoxy-D-xylulose-5-phosphate reductoisomerase [Thermoanaerobaculia bacterium]
MTLAISVLGSTGSVGRSALKVVRAHPERLEVVGLAAYGNDLEALARQVEEHDPRMVAIADPDAAERFRTMSSVPEVLVGEDGLRRLAAWSEVDRVVAAIVGSAGLPPVNAALQEGKDVALANKESLVVAGPLLMELARVKGCEILPVDSEHAALHQLLRCGPRTDVRRLVLTASGGPFWRRPRESFSAIGPAEALDHPTWEMGAKITVDSATLMNKGLELIEASHLFDLPSDRLEVVIHPQSLVHSFVEFVDGTWVAQLSPNDMVFPVQYSLSHPDRWSNDFPRLDPASLGSLEFHPVERSKFPCLGLARRALEAGG